MNSKQRLLKFEDDLIEAKACLRTFRNGDLKNKYKENLDEFESKLEIFRRHLRSYRRSH